MNVYDFDKTIYRRDSTFDFFRFCARRHPKILRRTPGTVLAFAHYALGGLSKTEAKARFFQFLRDLPDPQGEVDLFWRAHIRHVQPWYLARRQPDDVVISASPLFLVAPACRLLGIREVLASPVDLATGDYRGGNCDGEEKVRAFQARFPDAVADEFYSDSRSDAPMAAAARKAYMVRGSRITPWVR